jgi:DNA-binding PadR family transcriptional regulator
MVLRYIAIYNLGGNSMFNRHFHRFEHGPRLFEKGDIKYVILDLIKDKPTHGYDIIRALEERSHGFYTPSAGSIYPTLQLLQDMGYVTSSERDDKKTYTITEAGKKFLSDNGDVMAGIKNHMHDWYDTSNRDEWRQLMDALRDLGRLTTHRTQHLTSEKIVKIRDIIIRARKDIETIME